MNKRTAVLVALYFLFTILHYAILPVCLIGRIQIISIYVLVPALALRCIRYLILAVVGRVAIVKVWSSIKAYCVASRVKE